MTNNITTLIKHVIFNLHEIELDKHAEAVQRLLDEYQKLEKRVNGNTKQLEDVP